MQKVLNVLPSKARQQTAFVYFHSNSQARCIILALGMAIHQVERGALQNWMTQVNILRVHIGAIVVQVVQFPKNHKVIIKYCYCSKEHPDGADFIKFLK